MALYATWNNQVQFKVGDIIRVHQRLYEQQGKEAKERIQVFEGMVIAIKGKGISKTITVRKIGANYIGVEKIWPLASPWIKQIEVKSPGRPRRAKLYYTRHKSRKELRKLRAK